MSLQMTRRQFLNALTVAGAGMTLAACAPKAAPTAVPAPAKQEEPKAAAPTAAPAPAASAVEVRYASWWPAFTTGPYPQIVKDFQDANPNITIKLEEVPYGEAQTKYQTTLVAGTAADILYHMNFMSQYYAEDLIWDLGPSMDKDGINYQDDFFHGLAIDDWAGKIYGFPHLFETCIMLYNKTMIKELWGKDLWEAFPDGNWDLMDMIDVAKACTLDTNGDKLNDQWGIMLPHRDYYYGMEVLGWTRGDSIFDVPNMKYNFTSDTIKQVTNDLFDWVRKDKFIISAEEQSEVNKATGASYPFFAGMTAMHIRMSPDVGSALKSVGDKFEWDLFHLPNYQGKQAVTRAGGHGHNIVKASKVREEAYEFSKFCGTSPGMMYMATSKVAVPGYRKDKDVRAKFLEGKPDHSAVLYDCLEKKGGYGDHLRFHNEGEVLAMFRKEMDLLYNEDYAQAKARLDEAMAKVEKDMNDIVDYGDELPFPDIVFPFPPPPPVG